MLLLPVNAKVRNVIPKQRPEIDVKTLQLIALADVMFTNIFFNSLNFKQHEIFIFYFSAGYFD